MWETSATCPLCWSTFDQIVIDSDRNVIAPRGETRVIRSDTATHPETIHAALVVYRAVMLADQEVREARWQAGRADRIACEEARTARVALQEEVRRNRWQSARATRIARQETSAARTV